MIRKRTQRYAFRAVRVLSLVGVGMLAACDVDELLEVDDPDVVTAPIFQDPENLPAVHSGAIREFARAYGGTQNDEGGQVLYSGLLADEFYSSGSFTTRQEVDARRITVENGSLEEMFFELQRARNAAEVAADLFAESDQTMSNEHAEMLNLAGYTYILFGENFCGGVPFSRLPLQGETEYGAAESTEQIFARAIARFDEALAFPGVSTDQANLAKIGKARALLNLGRADEAAATVSGISTDYVYDVIYSEAVQDANNAVFDLVNRERRWSAAGNEGVNGLAFISSDDPRTPTEPTSGGFTPTVPHFNQLKYEGLGAPIPLATGIEARLIEAESLLDGGQSAAYLSILNELRSGSGLDLDPLADPGTASGRVDQLFRERAFWMWLTSHRLGDLRRLIRQYGRSEDEAFPIGATVQEDPYGDDVSFPVPFSELNNPEFDPDACDATQA